MDPTSSRSAGPAADAELEVDLRVDLADLHDPAIRADIEAALCRIEGVHTVRLVPGFERPIDELHALVSPDKGPKQAVRDLQSLLMARYGISIDHRVISVVPVDESRLETATRRVVITKVVVEQRGLAAHVTVTVDDEGHEHEGSSEGPSSAPGRRRTTARATLAAIRSLLGAQRVVEVEGVDVLEVLGHEVAISFIHFHTVTGENTVTGSALVRGDEPDAVARSVLDAVNRAIEDAPRP